GFDLSEKMIQSGIKKVKHMNLEKTIRFQKGDSENMPFNENSFDSAIAAFSVRNFAHLKKGLEETFRVLKPDGVFIILEFSKPKYFPFRQIYNFYFLHVLPIIGSFFTKDKQAYIYLPKSVMNFPDAQNFIQIYSEAGFTNIKQKRLTGGIASIYIGEKKTQ
ncbi:MAG: ubiquinone/menaquinone biosynthesis methyltransferase, partial [Prolixibacteraceae bacterium]|nr:ubiquinone/menaquinone biosynthesis methyltransferase [Prolixibacteraceae bacterium]